MTKKQTANASAKSATITLHAQDATLTLVATLKTDGTVVTSVTTRGSDKKLSRGMTEQFPTMDAARTHLASLAEKAEKLGWKRGARSVMRTPDAFSKLPAAPTTISAARG